MTCKIVYLRKNAILLHDNASPHTITLTETGFYNIVRMFCHVHHILVQIIYLDPSNKIYPGNFSTQLSRVLRSVKGEIQSLEPLVLREVNL